MALQIHCFSAHSSFFQEMSEFKRTNLELSVPIVKPKESQSIVEPVVEASVKPTIVEFQTPTVPVPRNKPKPKPKLLSTLISQEDATRYGFTKNIFWTYVSEHFKPRFHKLF